MQEGICIRYTTLINSILGLYVHPASHAGGPSNSNTLSIIYGAHLRLRADYNLSSLSAPAQVVARALQKYGMLLADGGTLIHISKLTFRKYRSHCPR
jgi:hypothetical protein